MVTSAYRTKAYNASLSGSATNSAHTRGFAADTPPPRGVSLDQHKQHVLQAFECGVGYYPMGRGTSSTATSTARSATPALVITTR